MDKTAETAIRQILERRYTGALQQYKGEIIIVGLSYDTVESVAELLSTMGLVKTFGTTIYVTGVWSSSLSSCVVYDEYPVDSGFLKLQSLVFIVEGDDLVLFNEDVRANNTVTITKVSEQYSVSGYTYIVSVEGLSGVNGLQLSLFFVFSVES